MEPRQHRHSFHPAARSAMPSSRCAIPPTRASEFLPCRPPLGPPVGGGGEVEPHWRRRRFNHAATAMLGSIARDDLAPPPHFLFARENRKRH